MPEFFCELNYNTKMADTDCNYTKPQRLAFHDDEARYSWLGLLLDAYLVIDKGVSKAIEREHQKGHELACSRGCSSCCTAHEDIPVYPLELMGISWYVIEKLDPILRLKLKQRLVDFNNIKGCPFLIDDACSIHAMRPISCRQFNVLNTSCKEGEDAYHTRRDDVMVPIKKYADEAFYIMLPFYGVEDKIARREAVKKGALHALARAMRDCQWQNLPDKMQAFDDQNRVSRE